MSCTTRHKPSIAAGVCATCSECFGTDRSTRYVQGYAARLQAKFTGLCPRCAVACRMEMRLAYAQVATVRSRAPVASRTV
jgi:hypothetical protein